MYRCRVRDPAWTLTGMPCDGEVVAMVSPEYEPGKLRPWKCLKCGAINGEFEYAEKEYGWEYEHYWAAIGDAKCDSDRS